jgi:hypothetical protein
LIVGSELGRLANNVERRCNPRSGELTRTKGFVMALLQPRRSLLIILWKEHGWEPASPTSDSIAASGRASDFSAGERGYKQQMGEFSGRSCLALKCAAERLNAAASAWNDGSNQWYSDEEEMAFQLETPPKPTSNWSFATVFNDCANTETGWNKSVCHYCCMHNFMRIL